MPLAVEVEVAEVDSEVTVEVPTDPEAVLLEVDVAVPETTLRRPLSPSTTSRPSPLWEPKRAVFPQVEPIQVRVRKTENGRNQEMCMGDSMKRNEDESRRIPIDDPTRKSKNPQNRTPPPHSCFEPVDRVIGVVIGLLLYFGSRIVFPLHVSL